MVLNVFSFIIWGRFPFRPVFFTKPPHSKQIITAQDFPSLCMTLSSFNCMVEASTTHLVTSTPCVPLKNSPGVAFKPCLKHGRCSGAFLAVARVAEVWPSKWCDERVIFVYRRNRTWPTSHSSPSFLHLKWCRIWSNEWSTYLPAKTGPSLEIAARRRRINSFWNQFLSSPFGGGLLVGVRRVSESPCKFRGGGLHRLGWFQPLCLARVTIIRIGIPQTPPGSRILWDEIHAFQCSLGVGQWTLDRKQYA